MNKNTSTANKRFRLHWEGGEKELVQGVNIADAFNRAGYGGGAIKALDYFEELPAPAITTVFEAKLVLDDCTREELVDRTYGDAEVCWFDREHHKVASGYFGNSSNGVTFFDDSEIKGSELRCCGKLVRSERNDG